MTDAAQNQTPPAPPSPPSVPPIDPEYEGDRARRKYRQSRRKARERAGEIKELNITAMMDMMTIILVFLLKSYTASSTNVNMTSDLTLPNSSTQQQPQDNINVTISWKEVAINDKSIVPVVNGMISGMDTGSMLISPVYDILAKEVEKQKYIAKYNPKAPFAGRVNIISDKRVPYQTLLQVLYTAGQAELGSYKLMALKTD
jgi:biopolymer transport protein ExbD